MIQATRAVMYVADDRDVFINNQNASGSQRNKSTESGLPCEISQFLDRIFSMFKTAPLEDLATLRSEDPAWKEMRKSEERKSPGLRGGISETVR